jgi:ribose/xylose/arabinose/galactoside ABC-type transport system permease subunit
MNKGIPKRAFSCIFKEIRKYPVILILVVFFVAFSVLFPSRFLSRMNMMAMISQFVTLMLFAIGPSIVMTMGSLDLSFVGIWMLGSFFTWWLYPFVGLFAILIIPVLGTLTGFMIGNIQARGKVPSFILTISILFIYWGLTAMLAQGYTRTLFSTYRFITESIPGVPTAIVWTVIILAVAIFIMKRTTLGIYFYAIGSNEEGSHLAGINVKKYKILAFTLSGLFTGIGSIVLFQHLGGSASIRFDLNMMNWPLVAIILGGTPLMGGSGGPQRTIMGALTLTFLISGLNIAMLPPEAIQLLVGLMLIVSIIVGSRGLGKGGIEVR